MVDRRVHNYRAPSTWQSPNKKFFNQLSAKWARHERYLLDCEMSYELFNSPKYMRLSRAVMSSGDFNMQLPNLKGLVNMLEAEVKRVRITRRLLGLE